MQKRSFIDPKDLIPGKIYGTHRGENCSKYLYLDGVFREKHELRLSENGPVLDASGPYYRTMLKWLPVYGKYLRHCSGWNQIWHELMSLTGSGPHREMWNTNLTVQGSKPEYRINFVREICTLFDPSAVTPETITNGWVPHKLSPTRPNDVAYPAGYWLNTDRHGTIDGFYRYTIILTPWTGRADTADSQNDRR